MPFLLCDGSLLYLKNISDLDEDSELPTRKIGSSPAADEPDDGQDTTAATNASLREDEETSAVSGGLLLLDDITNDIIDSLVF